MPLVRECEVVISPLLLLSQLLDHHSPIEEAVAEQFLERVALELAQHEAGEQLLPHIAAQDDGQPDGRHEGSVPWVYVEHALRDHHKHPHRRAGQHPLRLVGVDP